MENEKINSIQEALNDLDALKLLIKRAIMEGRVELLKEALGFAFIEDCCELFVSAPILNLLLEIRDEIEFSVSKDEDYYAIERYNRLEKVVAALSLLSDSANIKMFEQNEGISLIEQLKEEEFKFILNNISNEAANVLEEGLEKHREEEKIEFLHDYMFSKNHAKQREK